MCLGTAAGIAAGYLADVALGDPRHGHPVALFGACAARLERVTYSDDRRAGVFHTGVLLGALAAAAMAGEGAARRRGPAWVAASTAVATFGALGGTSLTRTGARMADLLAGDDVDAARRLLPSLCGRDPAALNVDGLVRASVESVAENTSDAQVAPLLWAAVGGVPALLVYRGANTLDAMIGHHSPRYERFGWAAAKLDDALNAVAARLAGVLVAFEDVMARELHLFLRQSIEEEKDNDARDPDLPRDGGDHFVLRRARRKVAPALKIVRGKVVQRIG